MTVELGLNDRLVDLAEEGWDLAIRIGTLSNSSLIARRIAPCRTVVCAAPSYLKARGVPRTVASLAQHNCLGYTLSRVAGVDRWTFGAKNDVVVKLSGNLRANNGDALRAAAIAGQGIIYQPTFIVADELRAGTLVALDLDQPTVRIRRHLCRLSCRIVIRRRRCARSSILLRAALRPSRPGIVMLGYNPVIRG